MNNKQLKITLSIISISIFCYHIFNLIFFWTTISDSIAVHFTNDTPDNWGAKYILFILPLLSVVVWFLLRIAIKKPEKLNYVNLTKENKEIQFSRTEKVMILLQNFSFLSLIFANEAILRFSVGMESNVPFVTSLVLLALCFITPIYLFIWAATLKY